MDDINELIRYKEIFRKYQSDMSDVSIELTEEERNSPEYQRYIQAQKDYQEGKRFTAPSTSLIGDKIDKRLEDLPFRIIANSTEEKIELYKYIMLLSKSKVGEELIAQTKAIAEKSGKITLKFSKGKDNVNGWVDLEADKVININSNHLQKKKKISDKLKGTDSESIKGVLAETDYRVIRTFSHELRHVLQMAHHTSNKPHSSLENAAKEDLIREVTAAITDAAYGAEKGIDAPHCSFYNDLKQYNMKQGMDEKTADQKTKETLFYLYLSNCKNLSTGEDIAVNPKLKIMINEWNDAYREQAVMTSCGQKISSSSDIKEQEEKRLAYLVESVGIDKKALIYLANYFAENRRTPSNSIIEEGLKIGETFIDRASINGSSVVMKTNGEKKATYINGIVAYAEISNSELKTKCTFSNGKLSASETVYDNGNKVMQKFESDGKTLKERLHENLQTGTKTTTRYLSGTKISKLIERNNGSQSETFFDELENPTFSIETAADGSFKRLNYQDGKITEVRAFDKNGQEITPIKADIREQEDSNKNQTSLPVPPPIRPTSQVQVSPLQSHLSQKSAGRISFQETKQAPPHGISKQTDTLDLSKFKYGGR